MFGKKNAGAGAIAGPFGMSGTEAAAHLEELAEMIGAVYCAGAWQHGDQEQMIAEGKFDATGSNYPSDELARTGITIGKHTILRWAERMTEAASKREGPRDAFD